MESIRKLEKMVEDWLKPLPHLPADWRKWLADNSWWLTLLGVILSALAVFSMLSALAFAMSWFGAMAPSYYGYLVDKYSNWWIASTVISLVFLALSIILEAMAINPLKDMKKKGWDLLFVAYLVGIFGSVVSAIVSLDVISLIPSLIGSAIGAFVGAYVLFEIRDHFRIISLRNK